MPSRWSFARRLMLDTSLEQYVGRLNRDRTGRHWQRPVFAPEGYSGTPRQPTPCLLGHVAVRHFPAPSHRGVRPGWSGGLSLGPLPPRTARRKHRRIAPTAQYRRRCAKRLGLVRPRDPSWCPVTSSFGGPPAAGRQRVFSWVASSRVVKSHLGGRMWSAIAGAQGTGACSRLSPPVPGPHGGRGHTCRTPPWACSVSSQSGANP